MLEYNTGVHRTILQQWFWPFHDDDVAVYINVEGSLIGDVARKFALANDERMCSELAAALTYPTQRVTLIIDQVDDNESDWAKTLDSCLRLSHAARQSSRRLRILLLFKHQDRATAFSHKNGGTLSVFRRVPRWSRDELERLWRASPHGRENEKEKKMPRDVTSPYEVMIGRSTKVVESTVVVGSATVPIDYVCPAEKHAAKKVADQLNDALGTWQYGASDIGIGSDGAFRVKTTVLRLLTGELKTLPFTSSSDLQAVDRLEERFGPVVEVTKTSNGADSEFRVKTTMLRLCEGEPKILPFTSMDRLEERFGPVVQVWPVSSESVDSEFREKSTDIVLAKDERVRVPFVNKNDRDAMKRIRGEFGPVEVTEPSRGADSEFRVMTTDIVLADGQRVRVPFVDKDDYDAMKRIRDRFGHVVAVPKPTKDADSEFSVVGWRELAMVTLSAAPSIF